MDTEFDGVAVPLPAPWSRGVSEFRPDVQPEVVRHALGYSGFSDFVSRKEPDAERFAWVPSDVLAFIARHGDVILSQEELALSGAIYLGNTVIKTASAAHWEVFGEESPEVWIGERGINVRGL